MLRQLSFLVLAATAAPAFAQSMGIALTNGVDGYLEVPYAPALVPQSGITLEAWVTYDETTLPSGWRYPTIFRQNQAANTEDYFLRVNADNTNARLLRFKVATSATTAAIVDWAFGPGQLNVWTHVAATYDGATAVLYVNGQPVASHAATGTIVDRGDTLRIGKGSDIGGPIEVWNGQIDEARLWPFARTQAEIQATMHSMLVVGSPGTELEFAL